MRADTGGNESWQRDVRAICIELENLAAPDDIIRRNLPRHAHPLWRLPRKVTRVAKRRSALKS